MTRGIFKQRCNRLIIAALLLAPCVCGLSKGLAQETKEKVKRIKLIKEIAGEVTWLRKDKIAVVFQRDNERGTELEMLLPFDSDIRIVNKKSLSEISVGDTVRVQYEEIDDQNPDGSLTFISRKAKAISFVRQAAKKPDLKNPEEGDVLKSE